MDNYIGVDEPAEIIFAKIMSISDDLMWRYIDLLSLKSINDITKWKERFNKGENPKNIKVEFAKEIVSRFHDSDLASKAEKDFNLRAQGKIPEDIVEIKIKIGGDMTVPQLLKEIKFVSSTSEAMRLIKGGGVKLDGEKIDNVKDLIPNSGSFTIQVGKRKFARIVCS
jgi:tyrosyl-tRNA synthetase